MTLLLWFLWASVFIALGSLVMIVVNLRHYTPATPGPETDQTVPDAADVLVTVCIPARNEERNIEACVRSVLDGASPRVQVLLYDDQSEDNTRAIIETLCAGDPRIVRADTRSLPAGWNGKQHACWRMAEQAAGTWMLFTDADVRFSPGAVEKAAREAERRGVGLLSTFPREIVGSTSELLLVPMIFFILFSYLPFPRMRRTLDPSASAGCGQFLLISREAYTASGGHAGFKDSMHDGIKLPRAVRRAGHRTDLFDGTDLAACRMYDGLGSTWRGFTKNAFEGLGSLTLLVFLTVMHLIGHVLPAAVLLAATAKSLGVVEHGPSTPAVIVAAAALLFAMAGRFLLVRRFRHPAAAVVLHPLAILMMTAVQWHSYLLHITGRRSWRGRTAPESAAASGA